MSYIPTLLWESEFPQIPMPPDCTYEQFAGAYKVKHDDAMKLYISRYVRFYQRYKHKNPHLEQEINELIRTNLEVLA